MEQINLQQITGINEEQETAKVLAGLEKSNPDVADSLKRILEKSKLNKQQTPTLGATPIKKPWVSFIERSLPPGDRD